MQFFIYILLFGLSIGLTVIGTLTAYRLKSASTDSTFSSLFYFQAFSFIYGFYGIWGSIASKLILKNIQESEIIFENLVMLFPFLAVPFLVIAWYLQLKFTIELKSIKTKNLFPIAFFSFFSIVFLAAGIIFKYFVNGSVNINSTDISRSILVSNLLISSTAGILLIIITNKNALTNRTIQFLSTIFVICPFLLLLFFLIIPFHFLAGILFILFFFLHPALVSVVIYVNNKPSAQAVKTFEDMVDFCSEFGISNRESEIITEICKGKTNREIAENLFISLQTVKDHSHRIYSKTGVSNRVQLVRLVNERIKK